MLIQMAIYLRHIDEGLNIQLLRYPSNPISVISICSSSQRQLPTRSVLFPPFYFSNNMIPCYVIYMSKYVAL